MNPRGGAGAYPLDGAGGRTERRDVGSGRSPQRDDDAIVTELYRRTGAADAYVCG